MANVDTSYYHALNSLSGSADVTYRIENRGNVRLAGTASVTIEGPLGLGKRTVALPDIGELLPGQDVEVSVTVEDVPALMVAFRTVKVEPADGAAAGASATTGDDTTFVSPLTVLLSLLFLLLAILARRSYVRHRYGAAEDDRTSASDSQREHQPACGLPAQWAAGTTSGRNLPSTTLGCWLLADRGSRSSPPRCPGPRSAR